MANITTDAQTTAAWIFVDVFVDGDFDPDSNEKDAFDLDQALLPYGGVAAAEAIFHETPGLLMARFERFRD